MRRPAEPCCRPAAMRLARRSTSSRRSSRRSRKLGDGCGPHQHRAAPPGSTRRRFPPAAPRLRGRRRAPLRPPATRRRAPISPTSAPGRARLPSAGPWTAAKSCWRTRRRPRSAHRKTRARGSAAISGRSDSLTRMVTAGTAPASAASTMPSAPTRRRSARMPVSMQATLPACSASVSCAQASWASRWLIDGGNE